MAIFWVEFYTWIELVGKIKMETTGNDIWYQRSFWAKHFGSKNGVIVPSFRERHMTHQNMMKLISFYSFSIIKFDDVWTIFLRYENNYEPFLSDYNNINLSCFH